MYHFQPCGNQPFTAEVAVNKAKLVLEVDTGAALSLISKATYESLWAGSDHPALGKASVRLKTYLGTEISIEGSIDVDVTYESQRVNLPLLVVAGDGPSLMGRN